MVGGVNMNTNSVQGRLEGFLGARVQHLVAHSSGIGIPGKHNELARGPVVDGFELQIDDSVTAIIFRQFTAKVLVCLVACALLVNDNRLFVFNLVHNVAQLLALLQFKVIKGVTHLVAYYNTCRLLMKEIVIDRK
jgi:hypothetical protein